MLDTLSILVQLEADFGAQVDAVLDFGGVDCQCGGNFGVLKSVTLRSKKTHALPLFFSKYQVSKATIVQVSHRVLTAFLQYKLTFVKMTACVYL